MAPPPHPRDRESGDLTAVERREVSVPRARRSRPRRRQQSSEDAAVPQPLSHYLLGMLRQQTSSFTKAPGRRDSFPNTGKKNMRKTYKAVQVTEPNKLQLVELPIREPDHGQVRVRVEACGVCHSDSGTVEGVFPITWPRVPGHEVVGRIDALGSGVQGWAVGQRVGVGFLGGSCGYCEFCRNGDLVNCCNQKYTGIHSDGGYAEMMIAKASGLMSIPDSFSSADAAPLLCAGLTTFNALRNAPAKAGDLVAVLGI